MKNLRRADCLQLNTGRHKLASFSSSSFKYSKPLSQPSCKPEKT